MEAMSAPCQQGAVLSAFGRVRAVWSKGKRSDAPSAFPDDPARANELGRARVRDWRRPRRTDWAFSPGD